MIHILKYSAARWFDNSSRDEGKLLKLWSIEFNLYHLFCYLLSLQQSIDFECYFEMHKQKHDQAIYICLYVFCKPWYLLEISAVDG
jgi:hypothetical protein